MNTTVAFKAAQRILDELDNAGFTFDTYREVNDLLDDLRHGCYCLPDELNYEWGASRVVFYDDNCDYVIKIAREVCFEKYNQREVEIYKAAEEEGYKEHFGWCKCYKEPGEDYPGIYAMEFLDGDSEEVDNYAYDYGYKNFCDAYGLDASSYDSMEEYESYNRPDDEEELMDYLVSFVDPDFVKAFYIFIARWAITDIHSGNILFRNGKPVICDYAGWGW